MKTTLVVYLISYKLNIFLNFDYIFRIYNQITGIFDFQSNNNSYNDGTSAFFQCFFHKRPAP